MVFFNVHHNHTIYLKCNEKVLYLNLLICLSEYKTSKKILQSLKKTFFLNFYSKINRSLPALQ